MIILVRTVVDDHFSEDGYLVRKLMEAQFSEDGHGRWEEAQPTFGDAGKNWSRDGNGHPSE